MHRLGAAVLVLVLGWERAQHVVGSADLRRPPPPPVDPTGDGDERDVHLKEARLLILTGLSLQLTLFGLTAVAFQIAVPNSPWYVRVPPVAGLFFIALCANYWVMALMPRADWGRFFQQTLKAEERRRRRVGWYRTPFLHRWYHESWRKPK